MNSAQPRPDRPGPPEGGARIEGYYRQVRPEGSERPYGIGPARSRPRRVGEGRGQREDVEGVAGRGRSTPETETPATPSAASLV